MSGPAPLKLAPRWIAQMQDAVVSLTLSPDETRLAAMSASGELAVFDTASGRKFYGVATDKTGGLRVSWGAELATAGQDGKVKWWNADSGDLQREETAGAGWVEHLEWSPDGVHLASAAGKRLRVWNKTREPIFEWGEHGSTISAIQWRPDGQGLATACYGEVNLFRLGEDLPYQTLAWRGSLISLAWSPNARYVAAGSQEASLRFWKLPYNSSEQLVMEGYPAKIKELAWDCESRFLATTGAGPTMIVWDVSGKGPEGRKPKMLEGHSAKVTALSFEKRGSLLYSGDQAGGVFVWEPRRTAAPRATAEIGANITAMVTAKQGAAFGATDGAVSMLEAT